MRLCRLWLVRSACSPMVTSPATPGPLANGSLSSVSISIYSYSIIRHNTHFTDNQAKIQSAFKAAFKKMSVLGHDINRMIDCSEVIPIPNNTPVKPAHLPAGNTLKDVQQAVSFVKSRRFSGSG